MSSSTFSRLTAPSMVIPRWRCEGSKTQQALISPIFLCGMYSPFFPGRKKRQPQRRSSSYTPSRSARGQFALISPRPADTEISHLSRKISSSRPAVKAMHPLSPVMKTRYLFSSSLANSIVLCIISFLYFYSISSNTPRIPALMAPMTVAFAARSEKTMGYSPVNFEI